MKQKIYIETSVFSYLTSRPSGDLIVAANQNITTEWWNTILPFYDVYVSEIVVDEASSGDILASKKRLGVIKNYPRLELKPEIEALVGLFIAGGAFPKNALRDAFHIAIATHHGMDYLLTWNCKHIANATIRKGIEVICHNEGYELPVICMPQELMGG